MQNLHPYDTTTQAMTEVALALSMAFFALLIVALLSFQVPQQKNALAADESPSVNNTEKIQLENASVNSTKNSADSEQEPEQVVFFYQGNFVDQQLKSLAPVNLQYSQSRQTLVLAVAPSLTFSEVMALRNKINHPNLSITLISEEWQTLLEREL